MSSKVNKTVKKHRDAKNNLIADMEKINEKNRKLKADLSANQKKIEELSGQVAELRAQVEGALPKDLEDVSTDPETPTAKAEEVTVSEATPV